MIYKILVWSYLGFHLGKYLFSVTQAYSEYYKIKKLKDKLYK